MKNSCLILLFVSTISFAQKNKETIAVEINGLAGNVLQHAPDLGHLVTGHPEGVMISFSKKTFGEESWQQIYNYPDYGIYFLYQDFKNPYLGHNFASGLHYNFYFLNRHLMFKIAEGIAYTSDPYNKVTNNKNKSFGTRIMANTNFLLEYKKENIVDNFGIQAGVFFTHFSNGRIKSPNSGINTYGINIGINYNFNKQQQFIRDSTALKSVFKESIKYNFVFRTGVNESPVINSGQYPFYHIGFYADKRLNRKSGLQLGTEIFLTQAVKDFIYYYATAYPQRNVTIDTDYKKIGVFVGHELFVNRLSLEFQLGYYVYQPFKFEIPVYDRLGAKYYLTKNISTGFSIKTHGFLAEALEFNTAIRF